MSSTRSPAWVAYDKALDKYNKDLEAWRVSHKGNADDKADLAAKVSAIQAQAKTHCQNIERSYTELKKNLKALVERVLTRQNLVGDVIEVDPDQVIENRFYIATYVNDWGWESAPSPVTEMIEMDQNDSVTVTVSSPPSGRAIAKWRLYRSNSGSQDASFQLVDEMLIGSRAFTDKVKSENLGEVCPTIAWDEPPYRWDENSAAKPKPPKGSAPHLRGVVAMPNGILAGFVDNYVAFSEPYVPYAWPVEYQITTEHPIVGLGVFGQTLFVGTRGYPYLVSGSDSASMSAIKLPAAQPCVSRRSIASAGNGVLYASPDGICLASPAGVEVITRALFAREDWQAVKPEQILGAVHEDVYYFWADGACWALDFAAKKLSTVSGLEGVKAVSMDVLTDGLFVQQGGQVRQLFSTGRRTGKWRSGVQILPAQAGFAWLQVDGEQSAQMPITVRWYGDGELRYTAVLTSITPVRLPTGRYLEHEVEVEGKARVTKVMLAGSSEDLRGA